MELDITRFFHEAAPKDYSASKAEIGENAGIDTWFAACEDSDEYPLLDTEEKREAFREFVKSSGGWDEDQIAAWTDIELNALCIQWVSGDMREAGIDLEEPDWQEYRAGCEEGMYAGRIFEGTDGKIYFYIGS